MKDTQDKIGYCQLSLDLLYEDSTEYDNSGDGSSFIPQKSRQLYPH